MYPKDHLCMRTTFLVPWVVVTLDCVSPPLEKKYTVIYLDIGRGMEGGVGGMSFKLIYAALLHVPSGQCMCTSMLFF